MCAGLCAASVCWDTCWDVCCLRVLGYVLWCGLGLPGCLGQCVLCVCAASVCWDTCWATRCDVSGVLGCVGVLPSVCWDVRRLRVLGYVLGYVLGCGLGVLWCLGEDVCWDACCLRVLGYALACVLDLLGCLGQYVCCVCVLPPCAGIRAGLCSAT